MLHIVFQEPDVTALQKSFELDESLQADIFLIRDDFAVGPLGDIYSEAGVAGRRNWWTEILTGGDYESIATGGLVEDEKTVADIKARLDNDPEEKIWIWAAQNTHDVCGYYWLMSQLKDYQGRVFILYLNNLPFINEKGSIFYPETLADIPAKEFIKAKKLAREITLSEFEVDPDEWARICNEYKGVRILEGGKKLVQWDYDFFDAELKKFITPDWQKASRVIHQYLSKAKYKTGDAYLLWRLKVMVAQDMFDVQGKLGNMKDFEIKTKAGITAPAIPAEAGS